MPAIIPGIHTNPNDFSISRRGSRLAYTALRTYGATVTVGSAPSARPASIWPTWAMTSARKRSEAWAQAFIALAMIMLPTGTSIAMFVRSVPLAIITAITVPEPAAMAQKEINSDPLTSRERRDAVMA